MPEKIQICFVTPVSDNAGGIAVWFKHISAFCIKNHIKFNVIDTLPKGHKQLKRSFFDRFIRSFFRTFRQCKKLKDIISQENTTILHIATSGSFGFYRDYKLLKIAKSKGLKTVLHLHFGRMKDVLKQKHNVEVIFFKKALRYVDRCVAIDKDTFIGIRNITNAVFINNPIEEHEYTFSLDNRDFIFVGRCTKEKGFNELIQTFSSLCDIRLNVIGDYQEEVYEKCKRLNNIKFYGQLPHAETLKFISKSSCLILPSYTEGMPNVLLEAMSFGIPCIGSRVGNIPEMLEGCGLLIEPRSYEELKEAIIKMSDDIFREKCSYKSYQKTLELYSLKVVGKDLIDLWKQL